VQKVLFLLLFLFAIKVSAQIDSIGVGRLPAQKNATYSILIPFSSDSLNNFPKISKNILLLENTNLKSYFFLFLLNLIAIAVFLFNISRAKVKKLITTLFSLNMLMQYSKVETKRDNSYLWAYFFLSIIFLAAIIYGLSLNLNLDLNVLKLTMFLVSFMAIDFVIVFFTGFIFKLKKFREMSHFNNFSFIIVTLPFLIVSVTVLLFLSIESTYLIASIILGTLAIGYLWKEFRNLLILKANRINIFSFYFFLYLCTFKILPLAIFLKITYCEVLRIYN
tara:strand:- start:1420 stop:2253 length:834 start_codon:yes stop_codon:yes gene_type:complete